MERSAVLGMGMNLGYQVAAAGEFPVRVLKLGRKLRVPTADLVALLGLSGREPEVGEGGA